MSVTKGAAGLSHRAVSRFSSGSRGLCVCRDTQKKRTYFTQLTKL